MDKEYANVWKKRRSTGKRGGYKDLSLTWEQLKPMLLGREVKFEQILAKKFRFPRKGKKEKSLPEKTLRNRLRIFEEMELVENHRYGWYRLRDNLDEILDHNFGLSRNTDEIVARVMRWARKKEHRTGLTI